MIVGIGIDIVEVARIEKAINRWGNRFLDRVFAEKEISYCYLKKDPFVHFAGKFAAKEAVIKALNYLYKQAFTKKIQIPEKEIIEVGDIKNLSREAFLSLKRIEIDNDESGIPFVIINYPVLDSQKTNFLFHLSISHEKNYAVSIAIVEKRD